MSGIMGAFCQMASSIGSAVAMFSTFPEDARWNAEQQAVEFGVEIGEYRGRGPSGAAHSSSAHCRSGHPRAARRRLLQRTRFESIADRKLARRQLIEDRNEEISGRDLRWVSLPGFGAIVGNIFRAQWRLDGNCRY